MTKEELIMNIKYAIADAQDLIDRLEENDIGEANMYADMLQRRAKEVYATIRERYMEEEE